MFRHFHEPVYTIFFHLARIKYDIKMWSSISETPCICYTRASVQVCIPVHQTCVSNTHMKRTVCMLHTCRQIACTQFNALERRGGIPNAGRTVACRVHRVGFRTLKSAMLNCTSMTRCSISWLLCNANLIHLRQDPNHFCVDYV